MSGPSPWLTSVLFAILVATVPLTWVFRIMLDLPEPLVVSYRRWPRWANATLIAVVTGAVTVFIRFAYYGVSRDLLGIGAQLVVVSIVYVFGLVLLVRQFTGLYPEYFVTAGRSGLGVRKAVYQNISSIETVGDSPEETCLEIEMTSGEFLRLDLPTDKLSRLYDEIKKNKPDP
jgi:hypothetical protein